ncbi:MAG TPA: hypothetical protein VFV80_13020 [Geminicoccaceae bacterium]|nr:hypothetical protein [Geminicoccaceae bacterium]
MGLAATVAALVVAVTVAGVANWQERRPRPAGNPSLLPYTAIQMLAIVVALLMAAHLVSLVTGHPLTSRFLR